ncbi:MAG: radical SAM protein [Anaerolineae bacterium]
MRILLIQPSKAPLTIGGEDVFIYEPLALEYVAAGVADHHDVKIIDLRLEEDLERALELFRPQVVGITAYTVHVNAVRSLFNQIKARNPEILTVVGGHHATVVPEDFVSPSIDLIVMGEGVFGFREIVGRFEKGDGYDGIPGVAFPQGHRLRRQAYPLAVDLDALPLPRRDLTARYRQRYFSTWMRPLASIRTSKGCPHRCSFCALWKLTGGRYLKRGPERVVEELAGLDETFVFFADDESLISARRMSRLATLIEEAGIHKRYFLYGRSDTIASHPELLAQWKDIGLEQVFVGLEFWRDEDLDYVGKGSTTRHNERAVEILQDLDVDIYASLIVRPNFDESDFDALRKYCRDLDLTLATFPVLTPLPGTALYERVENEMIVDDYDYFDFIHTLLPTKLPLKAFYRAYHELYNTAIPLGKRLAHLRKYRLLDIPPSMRGYYRFLRQVRTAHQDYDLSG